jgi:hypothetical protein
VRNLAIVFCCILAIGTGVGCAKVQVKAGVPGQIQPVNDFEAYAFKTLDDSQAGILKAKEQIANGGLPKSLAPDLDRAIAVYDVAIQILKNYDTAARAGNDVSHLQQELAGDLATLLQLLASLKPPAMTPPAS